jgi:hypothetical protein
MSEYFKDVSDAMADVVSPQERGCPRGRTETTGWNRIAGEGLVDGASCRQTGQGVRSDCRVGKRPGNSGWP